MKLDFPRFSFAALAALGLSCVGTDVGNGAVDLDFALYDSDPEPASAHRLAVAPEGLVVAEAWLSVDRVRLRQSSDCRGGSELEFPGPFAVDMLAPGVPPALEALNVPGGDYCRIEIRWRPQDELSAGAPAELVAASLFLAGQRADGTPFRLRSERNDELRLEARDQSFALEGTEGLFFAFDIQTLFDGVDLDGAIVGSDGTIVIEPGSNEELLGRFDDNLEAAAKLFADKNDDRELDEDESADSDVLAE